MPVKPVSYANLVELNYSLSSCAAFLIVFFPQTNCEHFLPEAFYFIVFTFFVFCIPVFLYCLQPSIKTISQHRCVVSVSGEGGVCVCVTLWNFFGTSEQSTTKQFDVRLHSFRKHLIITLRFKGIKRFNSQRLQ